MANTTHLDILLQGSSIWNAWRDQNPTICPDLYQASLSSANLENANLSEADLRGAILEGTNLRSANLDKALLQRTNLKKAVLYKATLRDASLQESNLREANLHKAVLEQANLEQANLTRAILNHANLRRCILSLATMVGTKLESADLRRCQLSNSNLREANLHQTDLRRANLQGAKLDRALLHSALLTNADLRLATLQEADLSKANLQQALLQEANLEYANLFLADLWQANLEKSYGPQAIFTKAFLHEAYLCQANFQRANFDDATLKEANLSNGNFDGADFQGTNLSEAILTQSSLRNAQLLNTNVQDANLRHANLSGALLDGACFLRADLSQSSLEGAATVPNATIAETSFGMANLTGAHLPPELNAFREALKNVEHTSKHARTLHLWLMGICLFALLTMAASVGAKLPTTSAMMSLPIINVEVPILLFFLGVPSLGIILFLYFHFYLAHLYQSLSRLPAHFPDGLSLREKLYPWMLNLCMHEWQLQTIHRLSPMEGLDIRMILKELAKPKAWSQKITDAVEILQLDERTKRLGDRIRTGIVVWVGWGLLPMTIGALAYPWLTKGSSSISYLLLGFLMISGLICSLSFENTRSTVRGVKDDQRWLRPLALSAIFVLSGFLLASQQPVLDSPPSIAHHVEADQPRLP